MCLLKNKSQTKAARRRSHVPANFVQASNFFPHSCFREYFNFENRRRGAAPDLRRTSCRLQICSRVNCSSSGFENVVPSLGLVYIIQICLSLKLVRKKKRKQLTVAANQLLSLFEGYILRRVELVLLRCGTTRVHLLL